MNKVKAFFMNQSLKKKWAMSSTIVIFISYAAICIIIYAALYSWLLHNEEKNAIRTADDITSFFAEDGSITIQELQRNTGLMKAIVHQNQTVRIFNMDGYEVLRINDASPAAKIDISSNKLFETIVSKEDLYGQDVFVVNRGIQIGVFQGYIQLIHPLNAFFSMMNYVLTAMLIAGIGALIIAGSISWYLANLLMKPIKDLRDSMASVRVRGFNEHLNFDYVADDEIGDLLKIYRSMMDKLQNAFAKQNQFVSDASHELRTPIQAIEGHLSLIKRWGKDDPEVLNESLETSIVEIGRMRKIIEELLNLAREEEKDEYARANIEEVIDEVRDELLIIYPTASIETIVKGELKLANITENALAQIIRNILENGIRYNERVPSIEIQINYFTENIFVTIIDNGIGIAKEHLPHIFDRFYRVDPSRENRGGGTGLGLSITKMLAEKYGVEIEVISKMEISTTFTLRFPLE